MEELTWRLQLEKRLRVSYPVLGIILLYEILEHNFTNNIIRVFQFELQTDLEEEKAQEIVKLQEALHAMQLQVEEANARVVKEREAARKAIEDAPPVIKETPVIVQDTEKIDSLTAEVESLKVGTHASTIIVNFVPDGVSSPYSFICITKVLVDKY